MKTFHKNLAGKSVYSCESCGKQTRETGLGEQSVGLCAYCFEVGGLENSLSDGIISQEEYDTAIAQLKARYNR